MVLFNWRLFLKQRKQRRELERKICTLFGRYMTINELGSEHRPKHEVSHELSRHLQAHINILGVDKLLDFYPFTARMISIIIVHHKKKKYV